MCGLYLYGSARTHSVWIGIHMGCRAPHGVAQCICSCMSTVLTQLSYSVQEVQSVIWRIMLLCWRETLSLVISSRWLSRNRCKNVEHHCVVDYNIEVVHPPRSTVLYRHAHSDCDDTLEAPPVSIRWTHQKASFINHSWSSRSIGIHLASWRMSRCEGSQAGIVLSMATCLFRCFPAMTRQSDNCFLTGDETSENASHCHLTASRNTQQILLVA